MSKRESYKGWLKLAVNSMVKRVISPQQAYQWIRDNMPVSAADRAALTSDGESAFEKEVRWARRDLMDEGFLKKGSPRGVWEAD